MNKKRFKKAIFYIVLHREAKKVLANVGSVWYVIINLYTSRKPYYLQGCRGLREKIKIMLVYGKTFISNHILGGYRL